MPENDFYLIKGDSYRGSRYGNFFGGGVDQQGNVSSAITENASNQVGTVSENQGAQNQELSQGLSQGLLDIPETPKVTDVVSDLAIGSAAPYAATKIGEAAGTAIGAGAGVGEALKYGASSTASNLSGGLIGNAAPTSSQLLAAPASNVASTTVNSGASQGASKVGGLSKSAVGGAAGAGIASAAITFLSTGDVKESAKVGAGTAIGTAIGSSFGPVGAFVGGAIGGLLCFLAGTPILMADGSRKFVEDIVLGDELLIGGVVLGAGKAYSDSVYEYKNTILTGKHAVFENGKWLRAEQSSLAKPFEKDGEYAVVYPIVCESHIMVTPWFISADVFEIDGDSHGHSDEEIIDILNSDTLTNNKLIDVEKVLPNDKV